MLDPDQTLALAERVALVAEGLGIASALIGAAALAVHGYTRGTEDIDLATAVPPDTRLQALAHALESEGMSTRLRMPDEDDPIGGVLTVWSDVDESGHPMDTVEIVNFFNPLRPTPNPARGAIARAEPLSGVQLRCVSLPDLVAFKLYAGSLADHADIVEVLACNADWNLDEVRSAAKPYDRSHCLEQLIAEAERQRRGRRNDG